jgi:hypothetical protein
VGASHVRRAGQPAEPPDDDGQDDDRQPDRGVVPEDGGPDGSEGDGGAGPGQLGPLAGQPRIGLLEVRSRRLSGWRVPCLRVQGVLTADSRASAAASRPMAAMAIARMWGSRERDSGSPWRSARWLAFHS